MKKIVLRTCILTLSVAIALPRAFAADRGEILSGETRAANVVSGPPYLDTWTFSGTTGERIIIYAVTTNGAFDTTIYLYPPGGGPAEASGWATGYGGDTLDHQLQHAGTYTILIQYYGVNDTGTYNLTFLKIPGAVSSAADSDGGPILSGQTLAGRINTASDLDTFQFNGNAGERVIICAVKTNGTLDTTITLYPPGGRPAEASGWITGYGGDSLDWQLRTNGQYSIVIADYGLNDAGDYNITFLKIPGTVSSSADPDGGPIASGQTLSGRINVASDLDAFQFYANAGEEVIIYALTTNGTLDTTITLYPPGGGAAEASGWMTGYGGDSLVWQLHTNGVYTIVIADYGLDHTGSYNITFLKIPGLINSAADPDGGLIASGQTVGGRINVPSALGRLSILRKRKRTCHHLCGGNEWSVGYCCLAIPAWRRTGRSHGLDDRLRRGFDRSSTRKERVVQHCCSRLRIGRPRSILRKPDQNPTGSGRHLQPLPSQRFNH